ncbi:hypothetical protein BC629DRAFT_1732643 [Irpex lacteus]|nr:hypothetical protein BC629DRAFT_1732643 [Irpex lacteus]
MSSSLAEKQCDKCEVFKPLDQFKARTRDTIKGKAGELTSKCISCMKVEADYQRQRKRKRQEEQSDGRTELEEWEVDSDAPAVLLGAFLANLAQKAENDEESGFRIGARVEVEGGNELLKWEGKAHANKVADLIEQSTLWHWSYETQYVRKKMGGTIYSFTCAQSNHREHKPKTPKGKPRDADRMQRFSCQGCLYITILEGRELIIKMKHLHHHIPYFNIGLPDKWKTWIENNAGKMLPGLMWQKILAEECAGRSVTEVELPFDEKAVRYHWLKISETLLVSYPKTSGSAVVSYRFGTSPWQKRNTGGA